MLYTIIAILALTAILGLTLLSFVLRNVETPRIIVILHGLLAATGLGFLLYYVYGNEPRPVESAVLLVIAALGGFIMVSRDLTGRPIPKWLAMVHGLVAVCGFIFLIVFTMNK
jgi:hypothetical protein